MTKSNIHAKHHDEHVSKSADRSAVSAVAEVGANIKIVKSDIHVGSCQVMPGFKFMNEWTDWLVLVPY